MPPTIIRRRVTTEPNATGDDIEAQLARVVAARYHGLTREQLIDKLVAQGQRIAVLTRQVEGKRQQLVDEAAEEKFWEKTTAKVAEIMARHPHVMRDGDRLGAEFERLARKAGLDRVKLALMMVRIR